MGADDYAIIDALLLTLSEGRERAEQATAAFDRSNGPKDAIEELREIERDLLQLHARVMDAAYFKGRGEKIAEPEVQLSLDS